MFIWTLAASLLAAPAAAAVKDEQRWRWQQRHQRTPPDRSSDPPRHRPTDGQSDRPTDRPTEASKSQPTHKGLKAAIRNRWNSKERHRLGVFRNPRDLPIPATACCRCLDESSSDSIRPLFRGCHRYGLYYLGRRHLREPKRVCVLWPYGPSMLKIFSNLIHGSSPIPVSCQTLEPTFRHWGGLLCLLLRHRSNRSRKDVNISLVAVSAPERAPKTSGWAESNENKRMNRKAKATTE